MADDPKILPTRSGDSIGKSREREMLAGVDPNGFRTRQQFNPATGQTTTMRTRGGFVEYVTEGEVEKPGELAPVFFGVPVAYSHPGGFASDATPMTLGTESSRGGSVIIPRKRGVKVLKNKRRVMPQAGAKSRYPGNQLWRDSRDGVKITKRDDIVTWWWMTENGIRNPSNSVGSYPAQQYFLGSGAWFVYHADFSTTYAVTYRTSSDAVPIDDGVVYVNGRKAAVFSGKKILAAAIYKAPDGSRSIRALTTTKPGSPVSGEDGLIYMCDEIRAEEYFFATGTFADYGIVTDAVAMAHNNYEHSQWSGDFPPPTFNSSATKFAACKKLDVYARTVTWFEVTWSGLAQVPITPAVNPATITQYTALDGFLLGSRPVTVTLTPWIVAWGYVGDELRALVQWRWANTSQLRETIHDWGSGYLTEKVTNFGAGLTIHGDLIGADVPLPEIVWKYRACEPYNPAPAYYSDPPTTADDSQLWGDLSSYANLADVQYGKFNSGTVSQSETAQVLSRSGLVAMLSIPKPWSGTEWVANQFSHATNLPAYTATIDTNGVSLHLVVFTETGVELIAIDDWVGQSNPHFYGLAACSEGIDRALVYSFESVPVTYGGQIMSIARHKAAVRVNDTWEDITAKIPGTDYPTFVALVPAMVDLENL